MPYYHVRITQKSNRSHDEVRLDLALDKLEQLFLEPYRKGLSITTGGVSIPALDIERIRINRTDRESSSLRPVAEQESRGSTISTEWYIARMGEDITDKFITGPPGIGTESTTKFAHEARPATDTREVFVVHGRNLAAKNALFEFLRSLDLHPLEWSEAVNATGKASPYIGEILDAAFSRAHAVVVIFTPDDEARLRESLRAKSDPPHEAELTGQARPNVLFEAGMAMARSQDRTVLVELGSLRPFSDVAGRHAIRLDNNSQRRQELAQRLQAAGCPVKLDGTVWHTAGDFEAAIAQSARESSEAKEVEGQQWVVPEHLRLSEDAKWLLVEAANSEDASILRYDYMGGVDITVGNKSLVETGDKRAGARWNQAMKDLFDRDLVWDSNGMGEVFEVTHKGFQIADTLGTSQ